MRPFIEKLAGRPEEREGKSFRPRDRRGQHSSIPGGQHAGLLLQRYLCENATGKDGNPEEKRAILQAAINATKNEETQSLYRAAFARWTFHLPNHHKVVDLSTEGRMIVGLGSESVLETGIRLHHTYGMPVIPGSALKGLAAHYCDHVWGERQTPKPSEDALKFRGARHEDKKNHREAEPHGEYHDFIFGNTDESGCIRFHDAWLLPDSEKEPLKFDVMTPHHVEWNNLTDPKPPTDFDSPVPVPFLSVTGTFRIAVSWHGPSNDQTQNWTELALSLVRDSLFEWGIGGKTSSGYGRFNRSLWEADELRRQQETERRQKQAAEAAKLAEMSPLARRIHDFLKNHPNRGESRDWIKLYLEIKEPNGLFSDPSERCEIARIVKIEMQKAKVWKDKGKDGERKKIIESLLNLPQPEDT